MLRSFSINALTLTSEPYQSCNSVCLVIQPPIRFNFGFQKSHFVDSRYKEFFPGSHIISGVLCSATWMENIKRWVCVFLSSPVHLHEVTSIAAGTLSSKALSCVGTTGYDRSSFVPTRLCVLGADTISLCIPLHSLLCAMDCLLSVLWLSTWGLLCFSSWHRAS